MFSCWLVTHLTVKCTQCTWSRCITIPAALSSAVLNAWSILGSRFCGRDRSGIESSCAMLDLPLRSLVKHLLFIHVVLTSFCLT